MNYIFKGTNGSMGLVTGNKYEITLLDLPNGGVGAKIFLTSQLMPVVDEPKQNEHYHTVFLGFGPWFKFKTVEPENGRAMPYVYCPYDSPELFKQNWRVADECRCTTPGQDDGSTTCWVHHNCMTGDCTHNE